MRFGSLFSGMGGGDKGLENAGVECAAQVEIDPACNKVLSARWPLVPKWHDVTTVNGAELPPCELIIFGSPCQDLSVAGKRAGMVGERSGLFFQATRIIREMREASNGEFPTYALWENVPGAQSSANGRDFGAALDALAESGAVDIAWRIINAEHWVPQRRRRVFVLALYPPAADGRAGIGRAAEILALTQSVRRHSEAGGEAGEDVAGTLGGGSGERGWAPDTDRMTFVPVHPVARRLRATGNDSWDETMDTWVIQDARQTNKRQNGMGVSEGGPMFTLDGMSHHAVAFTERSRADGRNLETSDDVAYALTNPGSGGRTHSRQIIQGMFVRRLTPLEYLRLQGFPDDWFDGLNLSDSAKYRMCGNAMATPVVAWIGRRILDAESVTP